MGAGFLEAVYQECLALEFTARGIPFAALKPLRLAYKGQVLQQVYQPDFICFDKIIVELKAVQRLAPEHRAQVLNYLQATDLSVGLLVNFAASPKAENDYNVNIKAELEIELLHQKIDELRAKEMLALTEAIRDLSEHVRNEKLAVAAVTKPDRAKPPQKHEPRTSRTSRTGLGPNYVRHPGSRAAAIRDPAAQTSPPQPSASFTF